jgi:hypothetical protein
VDLLELDIESIDRAELPSCIGRLAELLARAQARLLTVVAAPSATTSRVIDGDEMATLAGTSKRDILAKTRGLKFRCDLSRKQPRADEAGFRRWLTERRR